MSDRSFGDYTNRNVVKNPLLSTAVTGVSIEDLTQNAVLLPAVPSQELIVRQDQQHEPQMKTLRHSEHDITNLSSGDTNSTTTAHNTPTYTKIHPMDGKKHSQNEKSNESNIANVSKASVRSDDDFDVNEYFARLQGTRYVSAPLNSTVTDQEPDLQEEENLEEINLNEPDKSQGPVEVQQSLTADIAQNLSQLPNVLPHVASAVFSSFSNMLSLKSRDVTPDEPKTFLDINSPETLNTQIAMNAPEMRQSDIAPPPLREPPIANTSLNYRITTKKKVYAQIPGLSSGETQHIQTINARPIGQIPTYFIPDSNTSSLPQEDNKTESVSISHNTIPFIELDPNTDSACRVTAETKSAEIKETLLFNTTNSRNINTDQTFNISTNSYMTPSRSNSNYIEMKQNEEISSSQAANDYQVAPEYINSSILQKSATVIPPPPMFSNLSSVYSQNSVGKAVLPPSVARRLSANQPILKPQTLPTMIPQDNIFVPTIPFKSDLDADMISEKSVEQSFTSPPNDYIYNVSTNQSVQEDLTVDERFMQSSVQSQILPLKSRLQAPFQISSQPFSLPESSTNTISSKSLLSDNEISNTPLSSYKVSAGKKMVSTEMLFSPQSSGPPCDTILCKQTFDPATATNLKEATSKSNYFQNYSSDPSLLTMNASQEVCSQQINVEQPMFFNPSTLTRANIKPLVEENITQHDTFSQFVIDTPSELIKGIREPPKLESSINYRLSNKKPKYYSGPIDGSGSISNNVKPVFNPVRESSFQGALLTLDENKQARILSIDSSLPVQNENSPPFDLCHPDKYQRSDTSNNEEQKPLVYNDYNIAFDLSRPTTERFENVQQGSKGFGIIGSLKSTLSSFDINKIQNTVTTFFDPGYNNTKFEDTQKEKKLYYENLPSGNYQNFPPSASTHLKVFDPISDHEETNNYYKSREYFNEAHDYPISQISWDSYYSAQQSNKEISSYPSFNNLMLTDRKIKNTTVKNEIAQDNTINTSEIILKEMDQLTISDVPSTIGSLSQNALVRQEKNGQNFSTRQDHDFCTSGFKNDVPIDSVMKSQPSESTASSLFKSFFNHSEQTLQSQSNLTNSRLNEAKIDTTSESPQSHPTVDTCNSDYNLNKPIAQPVLQTKTSVDMTQGKNEQCSFDMSQNSYITSKVSPKSFFDSKHRSAQIAESENIRIEKKSNTKSISGLELVQEIIDVTSMPYLNFQLTDPPLKGNDYGDISIDKGIYGKEIKSDITASEEPLSKIMLPVLKDFVERMVPQQTDDKNRENTFALSSFNNQVIKDIEDYQESMKFNQSSYTIFDWEQSNLSLISRCPPQNEQKDIERTVSKINSNENNNENILPKSSSKFFDDIEPIELIDEILDKQAAELNICIATEEFSKPKEKVDDLTSQLIENITAPIQLANPVEYPLVESAAPGIDKSEISLITEEISEVINLPPPLELGDVGVNISRINYTWSDNEPHESEFLHDHDYNFQHDPLSMGFFQDKSILFENIPNNASDEIKAEYRISQEDMSMVPRPLNISTELSEEDTKSDESGLDVQSIEQDAKKDFPIFEEFVIEPSETDDGKIEYKERERSSDDPIPDADTFTNRVERYKKMETHLDSESQYDAKNDCSNYHLQRSRLRSSPAMTIASYFDTGNYAVENYYRNSLNSPTALSSYTMSAGMPMRIPPGFEEEYRRRISGLIQDIVPSLNGSSIMYIPDTTTQTQTTTTLSLNSQNIIFIPDTSTQTRAITTVIFSPNPLENRNISDARIITMVNRIVEDFSRSTTTERLPAFSNILEPKTETSEGQETVKLPSIIQTGSEKFDESNVLERDQRAESLTDPVNFFTSDVDSTDNSDAYNNFSRLSSYFTTPPKEEHSKSFFELSQSQDHYRHKNLQNNRDKIQNSVKNFFENSSLNNNTMCISNTPRTDSNLVKTSAIPQNYIENMNLISDLASCKNFKPKDDIITTVNYFTVQYGVNNVEDINVGESQVTSHVSKKVCGTDSTVYTKHENNQLGDVDDSNLTIHNTIYDCKFCCDTSTNIVRTDLNSVKFGYSKVRQCMDKSSENQKENPISMDPRKDNIGKKAITVNFCDQIYHDDTNERIVMMAEKLQSQIIYHVQTNPKSESHIINNQNRTSPEYAPVKHHWFYRVDFEGNSIWRGFSAADSRALEDAFNGPDIDDNTIVPTDGGRFDVNVVGRLRKPVYWSDKPSDVMRCSWFYKGATDPRYIPYTESIAEKLEEEYRHGVTTGEWHRRLMLPNNEMVVMHGPSVMVHFLQTSPTDAFTSSPLFAFGKRVYRNPPKITVSENQPQKIDHLVFMVHGAGEYRHQKRKIQSMMRPRVVRRGCAESEIEDTEPSSIDHLLLMCHGVGSACDMRFRSVEEVVDDFRTTSLQLIQSHYKNSYDNGLVGRVEVLPISWHSSLHSGETGVDTRLAAVTLESIPRLRNFTNDTLLDVLFYTSPVFCQTIIDTVCGELNRIYALFKRRNPNFAGGISLSGHSLGSVILYDLLCHQMPKDILDRRISTEKHYVTGSAGTGQPCVKYPSLEFVPDALYALGSPIAIFECIRGVETLGPDFCLPTCKNFFNIFHPYDPIAYRIEPMINPALRDVKPFLIPHHKGRKRMHLELKDTMARVGADIKQKLIESIKNTWYSVWKTQPPPDTHLEKVVEEEMENEELSGEHKEEHIQEITPEMLGNLNGGRRIDYVLQEAPFEMINEYLFAMSSHVCYWESEDTMLVMLREIYSGIGVTPDCSVPQNTMTVQRGRLPDNTTATSSESPSTSRDGS